MILLNNENIALLEGDIVLTENDARLPSLIFPMYNTSNSKLLDVPPPVPFVPNAWKWDEATQIWLEHDSAAIEAVRNPPIDAEKVKQEITNATSKRLDDFAQTRNYDSVLSASTYATSSVPQFAKEGQYCVAMRDATWGKLYQIMTDVESGVRPMPAGYADIESELPDLVWPL